MVIKMKEELYLTEIYLNPSLQFEPFFIESYYDGPISGSCFYNGIFYRFKVFSELDNRDRIYCLTRLGFFGKMHQRIRKFLYDKCVGKSLPYNSIEKFLFFLYIKFLRYI